ncbi:Beta-barrel assembly-enhancing protease [Halioglobus japonicus]|nr:Beta-barrel assembly-enhancing protease [Halioglobus japonicus]
MELFEVGRNLFVHSRAVCCALLCLALGLPLLPIDGAMAQEHSPPLSSAEGQTENLSFEQGGLLDLLTVRNDRLDSGAVEQDECSHVDDTTERVLQAVVQDLAVLDIERSIERIHQALARQPNNPHLKFVQSSIYAQLFQYSKSLELLDEVIAQCPHNTILQLRKVHIYSASGQLAQAEAALGQIRSKHLFADDTALLRAEIAYSKGDIRMAKRFIGNISDSALQHPAVSRLRLAISKEAGLDESFAVEKGVDPTDAAPESLSESTPAPESTAGAAMEADEPITPLQWIAELDRALASGDVEAVKSAQTKFVQTYSKLPLSYLFAFEFALQIEDYASAKSYLATLQTLSAEYPSLNMLNGRLLRATGEFDEAVSAYEKQIELTPNYRAPYEELFDTYIEAGMNRELIDRYEETAAKLPPNYHLLIRTAKAYRALGHIEEALAWYDKAIRLNPENNIAYSAKGNTLILVNQFEQAGSYYRMSLEKRPNNSEGLIGLASVLRYQDKYEEAYGYIKTAVEYWPYSLLANMEYAAILFGLGDSVAAKAICDALPGKIAMGYFQLLNLARCYENAGQDDIALQLYEQLYEEHQQTHILHPIALLYQRQQRYELALQVLEKSLAIEAGDIYARRTYAQVLYSMENYSAAAEQYKLVAKVDKDRTITWLALAAALQAAGRLDESAAALQRGLVIDPDDYSLLREMAFTLELQGKMDASEKLYKRLLAYPDYVQDANTVLADHYFRRLDYAKALRQAEDGLLLVPDDIALLKIAAANAHNTGNTALKVEYSKKLRALDAAELDHLDWLGNHYGSSGALEDAEVIYRQALDMEPDNQRMASNLAYTYYLQGRYEEALALFEEALSYPPAIEGLIYYNMGLTHMKLDNQPEAAAAFRQARGHGYPK